MRMRSVQRQVCSTKILAAVQIDLFASMPMTAHRAEHFGEERARIWRQGRQWVVMSQYPRAPAHIFNYLPSNPQN